MIFKSRVYIKSILYLGVIFLISLSSCSKDDGDISSLGENNPIRFVQKAQLYGEWSLYSLLVYSAFDFDEDGIASNELIDQNDCFTKLLIIKEDGTFYLQTKYFLDIKNNEIHDYSCINDIKEGEWILYENDLILNAPNFEFRIRVKVQGPFLIMDDTVPEVVISEIFERVEEEEDTPS